jgi:hypothetical protein
MGEPLNPDLLTPAERLGEIAEILAAGILRVRAPARSPGQHRGAGSRRLLAQAKRSCRSLWSTETESMTDTIAARVAALPKTPTPELKQMWRELFDQEPPGFGPQLPHQPARVPNPRARVRGLKPATRAKLDALADSLDPKAARKRIVNGPVVGTQLIREWRGVEHKVTVLADGFECEGRRYKSLSAVARAITGTRWNGLTFFGLARRTGTSSRKNNNNKRA